MIEIQPELQPAYESLCYQGKQFPEPHSLLELDEPTFTHPGHGEMRIAVDVPVLAKQGMTYVGNSALAASLELERIPVASTALASSLLARHLQDKDARVWGFSGFATGGFNHDTQEPFGYREEGEGLRQLYGHLRERDQLPSLAIDGGVSEGFLGLSSIVARSAGVATLGFIPREGLGSVGVRDHMVVAGDTYQDREALVSTADILVCAGGFKGTVRECIGAVLGGAAVLMLDLKAYPASALPNTFQDYEELRKAHTDKRLIVCKSADEMAECVDEVLQVEVHNSQQRSQVVRTFLSSDAGR